jgi:hypothetical protein
MITLMIKFSFFISVRADPITTDSGNRAVSVIAGSNPTGGMAVALVSCQVLVSAPDWSLVQRRPTEFGLMCVCGCVCVIECDQVQQ